MSTCPLCHEVYAANGSCSCDVDGFPPAALLEARLEAARGWCPWVPPVSVFIPSAQRVVLVHPEALDRATVTAGVCACGRPTRDHAYVCAGCAIDLARLLDRLPLVMVDLESRLTAGVRGIDYRAWAEPRGAGDDYRPGAVDAPAVAWLRATDEQGTANPTALPILPHVVDARAALLSGLRRLVAMCLLARLAPDPSVPVTGVTSWLRARVDAMVLHPSFAAVPHVLADLVGTATRSVTSYAGSDDWRDHPGHVDQAMQSALTAAEIAAATIRVGELDGTDTTDPDELRVLRERIRTTVTTWHHRGRITPVSRDANGRPRFRFGEVHLMLLRARDPKPTEKPAPTPARPGLDGLADWPNHQPTKEN